MHFVYKKIMTVNYLSPTGSIPTYQRIPVGSTTAPIERQSFINKDEKKTEGLHFLFKELIPLCITPETNVWINEEENASII